MFSDFLRKYNINPLSFIIVAVSLIAIIAISLFLRADLGSGTLTEAYDSHTDESDSVSHFLTDADYKKSIMFELSCADPLIDLKFIDDKVLFATTFNGDDLLNIYRLDIGNDDAEHTFSVYLNEDEDYCGLSKLNNGGFAFTTNERIVYLSKELKPQTELMLPKPGEDGRYDCILSPSGERVAYINSNGLYTNSIEFNDARLLLSTKDNGQQVRILRKPMWIEKGTRILYHFEDADNIDSVGFIASAGLDDSVLSSPSVSCFAYSDEKNTFFIAPDAIEMIPHDSESEKKGIEIDSINLDFVVSDNDGRRLMLIGVDSKTEAVRYDVLNLSNMKISTAFMLRAGLGAPCEPMALSVGGILAAHVEADVDSNTKVFIYSVREVN